LRQLDRREPAAQAGAMPYALASLPRPASPTATRLKTELAALGAVTELGFAEGGAEIERLKALARDLEAENPTPEPASAPALLKGRWHLLYSSLGLLRTTTLARYSFGLLPDVPVTAVEIFQETDPATGHYDNIIHFLDADGAPGLLVLAGDYRVEGACEISIRFDRAILTTAAGRSVQRLESAAAGPIAVAISYLDDGFRLVRGAGGSLYVLERLDPHPMRWTRDG
jgi:hypothetical protein